MLKFLKFVFIFVIIVVLLAGVGIYIFLQTFDVSKYKPQILREVSQVLNRDVQLEDISLEFSLDKGITLTVEGLVIADNPQFSSENFLTIKEINMGVDVELLLSRRQIRVSNINVSSPKITIIRNEEGIINATTIGKREEISKAVKTPKVILVSEQTNDTGIDFVKTMPEFLIDRITAKNGIVIYKDRTFKPNISVELSSVRLDIRDFSLDGTSEFSLEAAIFSSIKRNIDVKGKVNIDAKNKTLIVQDMDAEIGLSGISATQLTSALPMMAETGLEGKLDGEIDCEIKEMEINEKGLNNALIEGSLYGGRVKLKYLDMPFRPINAKFDMTEKRLNIHRSSFGLGNGAIVILGDVNDLLREQRFDLDITATNIDLSRTIPQKEQETQFHGMLGGKFSVSGNGLGKNAVDSATGSGTIDVQDAKLINMNVLRLVLNKISMIPKLSEKIEQNLSEKYKKKLQEKDTEFKPISINATIREGAFFIDSANIESDTFLLSGSGSIRFDQTLSLDASMTVPQDLTQNLVDSVEEFRFLVNRQNKLYFPVEVSGKVSSPRFLPDTDYLTKSIIMDKGKEELQKVLKKVLSRDDESPQPSDETSDIGSTSEETGEDTTTEETQDDRSPEEVLIDLILDKIFK